MTFQGFKNLKIGNYDFKKLVRVSDGLILFQKQSGPVYDSKVEYLESTGTQYIITNCIKKGINKLEVRCSIEDLTKYGYTFRNSLVGTPTSAQLYAVGDGTVKYRFLGSNTTIPDFQQSTVYDVVCDEINREFEVFLNGSRFFYKEGAAKPSTSEGTITLFGGYDGADLSDGSRIYDVKFYENGILTHHLIPVRKGNVGFMYDVIDDVALYNNGTGNFILGPDVSDFNGLCFTAKEDNSTIAFSKSSASAPTVSLQYSNDGKQWTDYTYDEILTLT